MANEATKPQVAIPEEYLNNGEFCGLSWTEQVAALRHIAAQSAELEQLRAENARLKAPVSDEEMAKFSVSVRINASALRYAVLHRNAANRIIQSRLSAPQKEEPHASNNS